MQELQAEVNAHRKHLNHVLEKGRSLAQTTQPDGKEVLNRLFFFSPSVMYFELYI